MSISCTRAGLVGWACAAVIAIAIAIARPAPATAAPPMPSGAHPRIALTPEVRATLKQQLNVAGSAIRSAIEECGRTSVVAGSSSGYQGFDWSVGASACALAYQVTGIAAYAARGVALWRALLEDVDRVGDRQACVAGVAPAQATASVRRDTGYAIRFVGLHVALAYDWLHDAPGADEALRAQSRDCFRYWIEWYTSDGYLRDMPGANYHAGYVAAKVLLTIAMAGEDGPNGVSSRFWTEVVDDIFARQMVASGLAGDAGGLPIRPRHGVLVGGDWPEGWQYGPLSVIEYALSARALEEQGVSWPELRTWADDLTIRFLYGLLPGRKKAFVGGDTQNENAFLEPGSGPLVATLIGPSSDEVAGYAAFLRKDLNLLRYGPTVFDALAEARRVTPADPMAARRPYAYLARGTRNLYARSSWAGDAYWAVITSAPSLVADHHHMNASSFEFTRGPDGLIVDPSPYNARSSLTGNAMTIDSDVVLDKYKPSQTPWGTAELPWARSTASGMVAARAEIAGAFRFQEVASDVPLARRDWVFLPEGALVVIDRAITGAPTRNVYLRFRTPATLATGQRAAADRYPPFEGRVGATSLVIHPVILEPPVAPAINVIPKGDCNTGPFGACTAARFPVNEYALKMRGADVLAAHVIEGLGSGEARADVVALTGADATVVSVRRPGKQQAFVVFSAAARGTPPDTLTYAVPGREPARHVVFDAPDSGTGQAAVVSTAAADGSCRLVLSASSPGATLVSARPAMFIVGPAVGGCTVTEEVDFGPATGAASSDPAAPLPPAAQSRAKAAGGGCGCVVGGAPAGLALALGLGAAAAAAAVLFLRRRR